MLRHGSRDANTKLASHVAKMLTKIPQIGHGSTARLMPARRAGILRLDVSL